MTAPATTPGQALNIGSGPGQNHFNIGVGQPSGHVDYPMHDIAIGKPIPNFTLTADGWARFLAYVNAKTTTSKTKYARDELRETNQDGSLAAWDGRTGTHLFGGTSRVMETATLKPWECVTQIHGPDSDLCRLQIEGSVGKLKLVCRSTPPGGGAEKVTTVQPNYVLGEPIEWAWEVTDGQGLLKLGGVVVERFPAGLAGCYDKCGLYLQTNLDIEKDPTRRGVVDLKAGSLSHWHTGWPLPTGQAPPSEPPAVPIPPIVLTPGPAQVTYTVKQGDTLSGIAKLAGSTVAALSRINGISDPSKIRVGQVLRLDEPSVPPVVVPPVVGGEPQPPVSSPGTVPEGDTIVLIRHAEKPVGSILGINEQGKPDTHSLTPQGWARAGAIPALVERGRLPKPDRIYASKGVSTSMRPLQTVVFLARLLKLTPITKFDVELTVKETAAELKALHGITWISMEHSAIVALLQALGIKVLSEWPDPRFDVSLVITRTTSGWAMREVPQMLLPGDLGSPLAA